MNQKIAPLAVLAALAAAGCSIPYSAADPEGANACSADSECPYGSVCTTVDGVGACVASTVDLQGVVIEVRPVVGTGAAPSSLVMPASLAASTADSGGQVVNVNLQLPSFVDVSPGQVLLPCAGNTPVPAAVTFQPVPELFGLLEGQKYQAQSAADLAGDQSFAISVPPGLYDVYLEPKIDLAATPDCKTAPPIFLPRTSIRSDAKFKVQAAAPLLLTGTLKLSEKEDFTKWYLEVVEPYSGQAISEAVHPAQNGIALTVPFEVSFDWTARSEYTPIVRLRPPADSGKPILHWRLAEVALQGVDGDTVPIELDVSGIDTQSRKVGGYVFHDSEAVAATVTLRSTSISGDQLAHYETVVETDDAGNFETLLPPGEYQVIARPHNEGLAVRVMPWTIQQAVDCYCGNSLEVFSATTLVGEVTTPAGEPVDVEVRLTPAANGALGYLGTMLSQEVQPRPANTFSQAGEFQVSVDPGLYDLSIVTAETSGYPWLVRPGQFVAESKTNPAPVVPLEAFQLQSPIVLQGRVLDAAGVALPGATVRALIPVDSAVESALAPSAVQIGATVADENGRYVLLLPPSIYEGK
jgi:hypothetical protein